MNFIKEKIQTTCGEISNLSKRIINIPISLKYTECGYKTDNTPPKDNWSSYNKGDMVTGKDKHFWFHTNFKTPKAKQNFEYYLEVSTGIEGEWDAVNPQGIVYINGKMVQGVDANHREVLLENDCDIDLYIYFYMGMTDVKVEFKLNLISLDTRLNKLYYDLKVPLECAKIIEKNNEYYTIMKTLEMAVNLISFKQPFSDDFYDSVIAAEDYLQKEFYQKECYKRKEVVNCIGHTHIDVAWMWTYAQTCEKAQRSFATMCELIKRYPEFVFMSSQPQLYEYVKENAPELYNQIKENVKKGNWEVDGAMWLEADCNLISGESLIRQILFGKRFIKNEFDVDSKILWLPDVFGYSAALPQILKKCNVEHFVTSKISWNDTNKLPYDTFYWEGIDGTEIFTNFITTQDYTSMDNCQTRTTYVGKLNPSEILGTWARYQQKELNDLTFTTVGFGDGGGGTSSKMLETQRRLNQGIPGMPSTKFGKILDCLNNIKENFDKSAKELKRCPKWVGELYLEFHRGTYTSIAKNKRNNRKSEFALQKAEGLSVIDNLLLNGEYEQEKINQCWKTVLLNQFHDVIPGSSIKEVYEDSDAQYKQVLSSVDFLVKQKFSKISESLNTKGGLLVYNPLGFKRSGTVCYNGKTIVVKDIVPFGWEVINPIEKQCNIKVTNNSIENEYYILKLDENGFINSLFDKRFKREVFTKNSAANELQIFEDFPRQYDAWEISDYYKQKMSVIDDLEKTEIIYDSDRAGIKLTRKYGNSKIKQIIWMYEGIERIDFETDIDWNEEHQLLKAAFPFDIHSDRATYEIQFGNIERPTHENMPYDKAKFEVCAHKWVDFSEDGYGVSILNDCKYGHSAEGNIIKLTLLKCATYPNPDADKGEHKFIYSLYPHGDDFRKANTIKEAYSLNQPLMSCAIKEQNGCLSDKFSLISCDNDNIIIETVKKAEDSDDIIVRLYDCFNRRSNVKVNFGFNVKSVYLCDMLERKIEKVKVENNCAEIFIGNFEIMTLLIEK